jgi:hypothetical protein
VRAAVELIRAAVKRKEHARGAIVVLDAAHFGALAWRGWRRRVRVDDGRPDQIASQAAAGCRHRVESAA